MSPRRLALAPLALAAATAAAAAAVVVVVPGVARAAALPITLSAARTNAGDTVVVSGTGCTSTGSPTTIELAVYPHSTHPGAATSQFASTSTIAADGSWSDHLGLSTALNAGVYDVAATCDRYTTSFSYATAILTVGPSTVTTAPPVTLYAGQLVQETYGGFTPGEPVDNLLDVTGDGNPVFADAHGVVVGDVGFGVGTAPGHHVEQVVDNPEHHLLSVPVTVLAPGAPAAGTLSAASTTVALGTDLDLSGTRCATSGVGGHVTISIRPASAFEYRQATDTSGTVASGDGTWSGAVLVPAGYTGPYTATVSCTLPAGTFAYAPLQVTYRALDDGTEPTVPGDDSSGSLPFTGSAHTEALVGTGLGLLVGGACLVALGRRRRTV